MTVFEAYITNLGKYAEGQLVGETLKFPATTEEVQSLLKNIGVDGVRYEEFFITAFDGDVMGLYDYLTEYENLDELNHLAHLISELDSDEIETLEAVLNKGDHTSSVADIINLVHNLDCYELHPGVTDDETLGRIYVEDMELLDVPDNVQPYFDFEAYGRDMRINEKLGSLLTLLMEQSWHPESVTVSRKRMELIAVKEYLDEHYTERLALDDLAGTFFINKFYLSKIFRETYGTTINNYLISKRITRAKQLLRFTDMTVDEVGAAVGMGDANYFSRMFRKVEGISPRKYRKQW